MPGVLRTVAALAAVLVASASAATASPQIEVGGFPTGIALDPATRTL